MYLSRFTVEPTLVGGVVTEWSAGTEEVIPITSPTGFTSGNFIRKPEDNHNGGSIAFAPDGYLFYSTGDGGGSGNQYGTAQDLNDVLGKILRLDVRCATLPCDVPADNPTIGGQRTLVYAYGFRNPWRIHVDRENGQLWVADVGQDTWEELDRVVAGGDYGWSTCEGNHPNGSGTGACPAPTLPPVGEYAATGSTTRNSIMGGIVYRGSALFDYVGTVFFGDFFTGEIWSITPSSRTNNVSATPVAINGGNSLILHEADNGELYTTSLSGDGVRRVDLVPPSGSPPFPKLLSQSGCFDTNKLLPYRVNAELWSDGLSKKRWVALPSGAKMSERIEMGPTGGTGDLSLPEGSVLVKEFSKGATKVETRLFMNHGGTWAGYTYRWNVEQTDASLVPPAGQEVMLEGGQVWKLPSRSECMRCHTAAAGFTLGLEVGQLNGDFLYESTNLQANQLATLAHIGVIDAPMTPAKLEPPFGDGPLTDRARAYLHANCSNCHRPGGVMNIAIDLRANAEEMNVCDVNPQRGNTGLTDDPKLVAPGAPERSVLLNRMKTPAFRMPNLGTFIPHTEAIALIEEWIESPQVCEP